MEKVNIIGYYKESPVLVGNEKESYIVVFENSKIDGSKTWLEVYSVYEGHSELKDKLYLRTCKKVTKEEYKAATKGMYTPIEYLQ